MSTCLLKKWNLSWQYFSCYVYLFGRWECWCRTIWICAEVYYPWEHGDLLGAEKLRLLLRTQCQQYHSAGKQSVSSGQLLSAHVRSCPLTSAHNSSRELSTVYVINWSSTSTNGHIVYCSGSDPFHFNLPDPLLETDPDLGSKEISQNYGKFIQKPTKLARICIFCKLNCLTNITNINICLEKNTKQINFWSIFFFFF